MAISNFIFKYFTIISACGLIRTEQMKGAAYQRKVKLMKSHIDTKCLHEGWKPEQGDPRQLPIYQSTTFKYDTSEYMG